jgi:hypothetical protein
MGKNFETRTRFPASPIPVQEVPPCAEAQKILEGQRFSVVHEMLCRRLPSLSFLVDGGCLNHVAVTDASRYTSLRSCRVVVATAEQCEDKRVKFPDAVQVINLNIQGDPEMLNIRKALQRPSRSARLPKLQYTAQLPGHSTDS